MTQEGPEDASLILEISAYLDGELGPDEAAELEGRLDGDPAALERFVAFAAHKRLVGEAAEALEAAGGGAVDLRTASLERDLASKLRRRAGRGAAPRLRWPDRWPDRLPLQTAAAAALVAIGWFGHAGFVAMAPPLPAYVSEAVGAHRVFAEDALRPAEFGAGLDAAALSWIAQKVGHPVDVPSLAPLSMEFVGARVHGTREGAIVQLIYQDDDGERLSLMLARHPADAPTLDFTVADFGDGHVGYWSDPTFDYAVVAATTDVQIRALAEELAGTATF